MSWPGEEWKVGLPAPALRAIAQVEQRLERLQKERQQKQVQLDTLEAMMHKQRQKVNNSHRGLDYNSQHALGSTCAPERELYQSLLDFCHKYQTLSIQIKSDP
uniref:Centromere protein Cenp-F N-terminal domain-containing protein n=1 Tax=Anolis carolinensis TaxID=28377 RepID=A0A803SKN2_ANOCA